MLRTRLHLDTALWLICIAVLAVRLSSAHWHLCTDGGSPPISFHTGDAGVHLSKGAGGTHLDKEVDPIADAMINGSDEEFDLPSLAFIVILLFIELARGISPVFRTTPLVATAHQNLRPPSRASPF
jgi:hypothetical protein